MATGRDTEFLARVAAMEREGLNTRQMAAELGVSLTQFRWRLLNLGYRLEKRFVAMHTGVLLQEQFGECAP